MEQDVYLAGSMTAQPVKRVGVNVKKNRELSWIYSVKFMGQIIVTCQTFLLNLYQITRKRLRIIQKKALECDTFKDMRGRHSNRPNKVVSSFWDLAKKHLESLPHKTSHYSRQKSSKLYFENPNLNVKILFQLFQSFYKESTGLSLKIGYRCYFNFFLISGVSFKLPRTDVCDQCTESLVKLKNNPNDACKTTVLTL